MPRTGAWTAPSAGLAYAQALLADDASRPATRRSPLGMAPWPSTTRGCGTIGAWLRHQRVRSRAPLGRRVMCSSRAGQPWPGARRERASGRSRQRGIAACGPALRRRVEIAHMAAKGLCAARSRALFLAPDRRGAPVPGLPKLGVTSRRQLHAVLGAGARRQRPRPHQSSDRSRGGVRSQGRIDQRRRAPIDHPESTYRSRSPYPCMRGRGPRTFAAAVALLVLGLSRGAVAAAGSTTTRSFAVRGPIAPARWRLLKGRRRVATARRRRGSRSTGRRRGRGGMQELRRRGRCLDDGADHFDAGDDGSTATTSTGGSCGTRPDRVDAGRQVRQGRRRGLRQPTTVRPLPRQGRGPVDAGNAVNNELPGCSKPTAASARPSLAIEPPARSRRPRRPSVSPRLQR